MRSFSFIVDAALSLSKKLLDTTGFGSKITVEENEPDDMFDEKMILNMVKIGPTWDTRHKLNCIKKA